VRISRRSFYLAILPTFFGLVVSAAQPSYVLRARYRGEARGRTSRLEAPALRWQNRLNSGVLDRFNLMEPSWSLGKEWGFAANTLRAANRTTLIPTSSYADYHSGLAFLIHNELRAQWSFGDSSQLFFENRSWVYVSSQPGAYWAEGLLANPSFENEFVVGAQVPLGTGGASLRVPLSWKQRGYHEFAGASNSRAVDQWVWAAVEARFPLGVGAELQINYSLRNFDSLDGDVYLSVRTPL
jgi:hypothetical protein